MPNLRFCGLLFLAVGLVFSAFGAVEAGTVKGYVYKGNGQLLKDAQVEVWIYKAHATTGANEGSHIGFDKSSQTNGFFKVDYPETNLNPGDRINVEFNVYLSGNKSIVKGLIGELDIGLTPPVHTIHVRVDP